MIEEANLEEAFSDAFDQKGTKNTARRRPRGASRRGLSRHSNRKNGRRLRGLFGKKKKGSIEEEAIDMAMAVASQE